MNKDKFYGAMLGLAVCDALGAPIEPEPIEERERMESLSDARKCGMLPGVWTDDTSMALCLLESLVEKGGVDLKDQMSRYSKWYRSGYMTPHGSCNDIGKACLTAVTQFERTGHVGTSKSTQQGNGSLMRTVAVALYNPVKADFAKTAEVASKCSSTTHGSKIASDACVYYTKLIILALNGATKDEILSLDQTKGLSLSQEVLDTIKTYGSAPLESLSGRGHVLETLKLALRAFKDTKNFTDGAIMAVNRGKDSDTVGAVYGQLAGAYYGLTGINHEWLNDLVNTPLIMKVIDSAWNHIQRSVQHDDSSEDDDDDTEADEKGDVAQTIDMTDDFEDGREIELGSY